jgi:hypothetical protein
MWADLLSNWEVSPKQRRYSVESFIFSQEIHDISAAAYQVISRILLLPSDRLLRAKFLDEKTRVRNAVLDLSQLDDLFSIWKTANNLGPGARIPVFLGVDAAAFKPLITIQKDGSVKGIEGFDCLESPNLFSEFVSNPHLFYDFVVTRWNEAYSAFFAFQAQPISHQFTCCAVHVIQAVNGKGTPEIVRKLEQIKDLPSQNCFDIVGYAFDGDSYHNRLHRQFQKSWRCQSRQLQDPRGLFDMPVPSLLICSDILHVLKEIRYRFVSFDANSEAMIRTFFTQSCACSCSTSTGCLAKHESHKDARFSSIASVFSADNMRYYRRGSFH